MAAPITTNHRKVGRPYSRHTKLGRALFVNREYAWQFCRQTNINPRRMGDYLAGVVKPTYRHIVIMCQVLDCEPADLVEEFYPYTAADHAVHGRDSTSIFNDDFLDDPLAPDEEKALLTGVPACT